MKFPYLLAAAALVATPVVAIAALTPSQASAIMKARHEGMEQIGKSMRAARKSLDEGNAAGVRTSAQTIDRLAAQSARWFPAGTGPEAGKTHAKKEIWEQPAKFAAAMRDFRAAAATFNRTAQGSDLAATRLAQANLGKTCKSCHDQFQEKH